MTLFYGGGIFEPAYLLYLKRITKTDTLTEILQKNSIQKFIFMKAIQKTLLIVFLGTLFLTSCNGNNDTGVMAQNNSIEAVYKTTLDHFNTVIATQVNQDVQFVQDIGQKVTKWETLINTDPSLNVSFDEVVFEIEDSKYFIVGRDSNFPATSKVQLVYDRGNFYEFKYSGETLSAPGYGLTITCSGCTSTGPGSSGECEPKGDENGYYCTSCSSGTCTKSASTGSSGVF